MTRNEFNRQIDALGFERDDWPGMTVILNISPGHYGKVKMPVAKISKTKRFEFDMLGYRELWDMPNKTKEKLFNILTEYASTPLEYRE